jgi:hypothetical protein
MKNINTKTIVLFSSFVAIVLYVLADLAFSYDRCFATGRCPALYDFINSIAPLILTLVPLFVFSLLTYKMREEVFRAWWNFARWWVPVIVAVTIFLNNAGGSGGGYIGMGQDFTFFILGTLYVILILVSLVKIVRAYSKK